MTNICVRTAIKYLNRNLDRHLRLDDLADIVRVSPRHFNRLLKARFGISFQQLVLHLRMRRAAKLLRRTRLDVQQIPARVGLKDYKHFLDLFKKFHRMTPTQYRNHHLMKLANKRWWHSAEKERVSEIMS